MSSLPKSLEITVTKEQPTMSDKASGPSRSTNTNGTKPENLDPNKDMLHPPRTPPYRTGAKKEPGTEDEACEDAIASGDTSPSWEGVWRKDRRDVTHHGPGGAS